MKKKKDLPQPVRGGQDQPSPSSQSTLAETLIREAMDKGLPVETLEKLLALRDRLKEEQARTSFFEALSAFQQECPEISRDKVVKNRDGSIRYRYASLDTIIREVKPLLAKYGFSYSFATSFHEGETVYIKDKQGREIPCKQGAVIVTCTAHHKDGWSEQASFRAPIEIGANMGEIQRWGSALSYAKRYAFCAVFGIMTADEDTDGITGEEEERPTPQPAPKKYPDTGESIISEAQRKRLWAIATKAGLSNEQAKSIIRGFGYDSSKDIQKKDYEAICEMFDKIGAMPKDCPKDPQKCDHSVWVDQKGKLQPHCETAKIDCPFEVEGGE